MSLETEKGKGQKETRQLALKQRLDEKWGKIIQNIEERGAVRQGTKSYHIYAGLLFLEKEEARNGWVLRIPKEEVRNVLERFHDEKLHPGINKMNKMLGNLATWKGMTRDIIQYVRSCHACQLSKSKPYTFSGPMQAIIPHDVGDIVAIDIFGPLL